MNHFAIFLGLISVIGFALATDYCSGSKSLCSFDVNHIACGHSGKFAKSCSSDAAIVEMNANLKELIVNLHNEKRNFIAGGGDVNHNRACRMATMQWDDELSRMAALNVKQCQMAHDWCHNTAAFIYSGQNLASISFVDTPSNENMLAKVISMWYEEVKDSKRAYIASYPRRYRGPSIGHFTVMMADRNIRVGCAAATYSTTSSSDNTYLVACNYATTNMIDYPIYASCRNAASSCHTGKNPKYPNLCSTSEVYHVNKW